MVRKLIKLLSGSCNSLWKMISLSWIQQSNLLSERTFNKPICTRLSIIDSCSSNIVMPTWYLNTIPKYLFGNFGIWLFGGLKAFKYTYDIFDKISYIVVEIDGYEMTFPRDIYVFIDIRKCVIYYNKMHKGLSSGYSYRSCKYDVATN